MNSGAGNVFIYALTDPETGEVRYVGMTDNPKRRYTQHVGDKSKLYKANWITGLKKRGLAPEMPILEEVPFEEWEAAEIKWIAHYRALGARLTNATAGGGGILNATPEVRAAISAGMTGARNPNFGKVYSEEDRARLSAALAGKKKPAGHGENVARARTGTHLSEEARAKIGNASRGRKASEETLARLSAAKKGRKFSEEHKRKISEALKGNKNGVKRGRDSEAPDKEN